jgi:hypothetical protein
MRTGMDLDKPSHALEKKLFAYQNKKKAAESEALLMLAALFSG